MTHIHIHLAAPRKTRDFDFAKAPFYLLKQDTSFPLSLGWRKTSNMADPKLFYVPSSTVFYQVSPGRFVPHFAKSGTPASMSESQFQKETRDSKAKDSTFTGTESAWATKVKDLYPSATFRPRPIGKVSAKVGDKDVGEYDKQKGAGTIVDKTEDATWSMVKRLGNGYSLMEGVGPAGGKFALVKGGRVITTGTEEHCILSYDGLN